MLLKQFQNTKDLKLSRIVEFEQRRLQLQKDHYDLAEKEDIIIVKEEGFSLDGQRPRTNYVYCYGLPYDLEEFPGKVRIQHPHVDLKVNLVASFEAMFGPIKRA